MSSMEVELDLADVIVPGLFHGTEVCTVCGTMFDTLAVDPEDMIPPIGEGCVSCMGEDDEL